MSQTSAAFFVLLALSKGPLHGLGVAEDVADFTEGEVLLGPGTLYRCLRELLETGDIERASVAETPDATHRKHYSLTAAGEARLRRSLVGLDRVIVVGRARVEIPAPQGA